MLKQAKFKPKFTVARNDERRKSLDEKKNFKFAGEAINFTLK